MSVTPVPIAQHAQRAELASRANAAAATAAPRRTTTPIGARRMPPVQRTQQTEFLDVPVYHAPFGPSHHEWPIIDTYARLVWRADEHQFEYDEMPDPDRWLEPVDTSHLDPRG